MTAPIIENSIIAVVTAELDRFEYIHFVQSGSHFVRDVHAARDNEVGLSNFHTTR